MALVRWDSKAQLGSNGGGWWSKRVAQSLTVSRLSASRRVATAVALSLIPLILSPIS